MKTAVIAKFTLGASLVFSMLTFGSPALAANKDGPIWRISWTDIHPTDELVLVNDVFRLKLTGNHYQFKPIPPMSNRWGSAKDYKAKLVEKADNLYCGEIKLKTDGHEYAHGLSLSRVKDDFVILHFYALDDDAACTYQTTHGGLAHGEP